MSETLLILPPSFWVVIALIGMGSFWAATNIRGGMGFPVLTVLGTVAAWYVGDVFYNDYANNHARIFTPNVLDAAWWEVALFLAAFLCLTPVMHRWLNARVFKRPSRVVMMFQNGVGRPQFQLHLNQLFWACVTVWGVLVVVAAIRLGDQIVYYFFPFLGEKADPWARGMVGTGADSLLSLAGYFQMFVAMVLGVVAALAQDRRVRAFAVILCLVVWPYYFFDRVRNAMLAVSIPAFLGWVFLRLRVAMVAKIVILAAGFLLVSAWFQFVIANRTNTTVASAFHEEAFHTDKDKTIHHEGLNMFEELCWINTFIVDGSYSPNGGARYFAEIVNPIPRALWPGKPMIGIDYAVARGFSSNDEDGVVVATVSTGMIGQGVVNFGRILGPAFAALLMSLWAALLAGLDLRGEQLGRIPLYALGLVLTYNMGRDITLITLYVFVFGKALVWCLEHWAAPRFSTPARGNPKTTNRSSRSERRKTMRNSREPIQPRPALTSAASLGAADKIEG